MTELREKIWAEVSAVLTDESGCSGAPYAFEGKMYQDYDDTVPLTRIADAILDIPEMKAAVAMYGAQMDAAFHGTGVVRIERIDPAEMRQKP